jgi:hypothetical protein
MYGLVNQAIEDMVCTQYGETMWQEIKQEAQISINRFAKMEGYPDDLTHRLIRAAAQKLQMSAAEIMEAFGAYWIKYTAETGYGELMDVSGDNLPEFLENLDDLHARVGVSFPKLQPPSFECTAVEDDSLNLNYHSQREGLAPMVIGLVKGLGNRFETEVTVEQTQSREQGAEYDSFFVHYQE